MALGSVFKPRGKIEVLAPDSSMLGQQVSVSVLVIPEEEIKPKEVRVELVGEETYYETERHYDSDSPGHKKTRIVKRNEPFASIVQVVATQPTLFKGSEQKWSCSPQLPEDSGCTCHGKVVDIRWKLKAVVDVPNRPDLSCEKPLNVLSLPAQQDVVASPPAERSFGAVDLSLKVPASARAGSLIKGQLSLRVKEKLSVRSIRVELVRAELAGNMVNQEVVSKAHIIGDTNFNALESPSYDFSLEIPAGIPPTSIGKESSLRWKVRAVLDFKMRTDFNVEKEIIISNTSKL